MAFATNNDLYRYTPDIFEHGVEDWAAELSTAEADVADYVRVKYYQQHHSSNNWNVANLTETQWTKATVYRALSTYILPKLATFRLDDVFVEQIKFYKERYAEEMDLQFAIGIQYDANEDGTITEAETIQYTQDRLYR